MCAGVRACLIVCIYASVCVCVSHDAGRRLKRHGDSKHPSHTHTVVEDRCDVIYNIGIS